MTALWGEATLFTPGHECHSQSHQVILIAYIGIPPYMGISPYWRTPTVIIISTCAHNLTFSVTVAEQHRYLRTAANHIRPPFQIAMSVPTIYRSVTPSHHQFPGRAKKNARPKTNTTVGVRVAAKTRVTTTKEGVRGWVGGGGQCSCGE